MRVHYYSAMRVEKCERVPKTKTGARSILDRGRKFSIVENPEEEDPVVGSLM